MILRHILRLICDVRSIRLCDQQPVDTKFKLRVIGMFQIQRELYLLESMSFYVKKYAMLHVSFFHHD